jgi:glyoxylase-like metal-dependent hydrolase (beta-lactamase superfamily II)
LAWTVIGLAAGLMPAANRGFSCRFLAVGHGSVLIELPDGKVVLYDAGSMNSRRVPHRAAGVAAGDLAVGCVIVSHADADHCMFAGTAGQFRSARC